MQGFAYVTFSSHGGLQAALQMNGKEVEGRSLSVALAHQQVSEGQREAFVLNVPPSADKEALEQLFSVCGPIQSVRLPLSKDTNELRVRASDSLSGHVVDEVEAFIELNVMQGSFIGCW